MKDDAPKKRKQPDPPKEVISSDFMDATKKSASTQKSEKEQLKRVNKMLDVNSTWMAKLPERLTLPFQYIVETIIEDYWAKVCSNKGMETMRSSLAMCLFISTIYSHF